MPATTITVSYCEDRCRVEFRLDEQNRVEGRYLPGRDGIGSPSDWELREVDDSSDEQHVATLCALDYLLHTYNGDTSKPGTPAYVAALNQFREAVRAMSAQGYDRETVKREVAAEFDRITEEAVRTAMSAR